MQNKFRPFLRPFGAIFLFFFLPVLTLSSSSLFAYDAALSFDYPAQNRPFFPIENLTSDNALDVWGGWLMFDGQELPQVENLPYELSLGSQEPEIASPSFEVSLEGFDFSWNPGRRLNFVSAGFYWYDVESSEDSKLSRDLKIWSKKSGVLFPDFAVKDPNLQSKDFSFYLSSNIGLHKKTNIQLDQYGSRTSILVSNGFAAYDYAGSTAILTHALHEKVTVRFGYNASFERYSQTGFDQRTLSYAPMADIEVKPFKQIRGFENFALGVYGELRAGRYEEGDYYLSQSISRTAGVSLHWDVLGFKINPGISLRREVADLQYPEPALVTTRYFRISKKQQIGKIFLSPFVDWSIDSRQSLRPELEDSSHFKFGFDLELTKKLSLKNLYSIRNGKPLSRADPEPKTFEAGMDLKYKIHGRESSVFLIHGGYGEPLTVKAKENHSEASALAALRLQL